MWAAPGEKAGFGTRGRCGRITADRMVELIGREVHSIERDQCRLGIAIEKWWC